MKNKIANQVLKEVKKKWNDETQVGFSELAMQDAIKLALTSQTKRFQDELFKLDDWDGFIKRSDVVELLKK